MSAVLWQRIEGALVFVAGLLAVIALRHMLPGSGLHPMWQVGPWWLLVLLFFAPDLGFLGYLGGPRVGAAVYNALHLYGLGLLLVVAGAVLASQPLVSALGLLWMAHVGFDRMLGYGLKEPTAFADTHLGRIGRR